MIGFLRGSLRLLVFAGSLLAGLQVPSYLEQYEQRVDAHLLEVTANLSGFQATANQLFAGNMEALIAYYENSGDQVFEMDSNSVRSIYTRYLNLSREQQAVGSPWYTSAYHVLFRADPTIRAEAVDSYSYTVPLDLRSLEWGFGIAIAVTLLIELVMLCCASILPGRRRGRRRSAA